VVVIGTTVGVGVVREAVGDGSVGCRVGTCVGSCVGARVGSVVGVGDVALGVAEPTAGVGIVPGLAVLRGVVVVLGAAVVSVVVALVGTAVGSEARTCNVPPVSSPSSNGLNSTAAISASGTATIAPTLTRLGPPYRPIGPRTGSPASLTQNAQPAGAGGQDSDGRQCFGGFQRLLGGSGQPGAALNCLTVSSPSTTSSLAIVGGDTRQEV
jgi:hypothetical protein